MNKVDYDFKGVTVFCITYNHVKYIRRALDSFLEQKTKFPVEIIVHDDASTDGTRDIVKQYAKTYKSIKPILENENQYSRGVNINKICLNQVRGKYIALCEGDDFWNNSNKLQEQYEILESEPDCHLCLHKTLIINTYASKVKGVYPQFHQDTGFMTCSSVLNNIGMYGTCYRLSSYFYRTCDHKFYYNNMPDFRKVLDVGDGPLLLYLSQLGLTYYINKPYSCYRLGVKDSWTTKQKYNIPSRLKHYESWQKSIKLYNDFTEFKYEQECAQIHKYWEFSKQIASGNWSVIHDYNYKDIYKAKGLRFAIKLKLKLISKLLDNIKNSIIRIIK